MRLARLARLARREGDVLDALALGLDDARIAEHLTIGVGTVQTHVGHIISKLGVGSRLEAVVFAVRHGAIKLE